MLRRRRRSATRILVKLLPGKMPHCKWNLTMDENNIPGSTEPHAAVPAAINLPNAVRVQKTFSLPGIGFCLATASDESLIYTGLSDFSIVRANLSSEKIEPSALGAAGHTSYVMGLVRCTGRVGFFVNASGLTIEDHWVVARKKDQRIQLGFSPWRGPS